MTELLKGSSSVFRIEAHMSLKTKYCHNVFDIVEFKERCTELLLEAADVIGIEITELGYDRNHVHLDIRWMRISLSVDRDCKEAQGNHRKETPEGVSGRQEEVLLGLRPVVTGYLRRQHGQEPDQIRDYIRNQGKESSVHAVSLMKFFNLTN